MRRITARTLLALTLMLCVKQVSAQEGAEYTITFTGMWTATSHPFEYPEAGLLTGPHLSGLIGCTHDEQFSLYKEGTPPTPGLENLSENGKHAPLDKEIKDAIAAGKAGALFETGPIRDMSKSETTRVSVTDRYPLVSAVAMIAPSPDWFAGAANINLKEGGQWVATKTVELYAYDSGGDDGSTYKAADKDTDPKKSTTVLGDDHFVVNGKKPPVARLTFTKQ